MSACMCGATDCPSCGPAQGYTVVKVWNWERQCYEYKNPEPEEPEGIDSFAAIAAAIADLAEVPTTSETPGVVRDELLDEILLACREWMKHRPDDCGKNGG